MVIEDKIQEYSDDMAGGVESLIIPDSTRDRLVQEKEGIRTSTSYVSDLFEELGLQIADDDVLSPQQANDLYGVDGVLQFQEPIKKSLAELKYSRVRKGQLIDQFLSQAQQQDQSFGRGVRDFGNALAVQAFDPINYIPTTRMLKMSKLASGVARGAIDGAVGNLITTPFAAEQYKKYGMSYGIEDAIFEVSIGAFIGGTFGGIGGKLEADAKALETQRESLRRQYKSLDSQVTEEGRAALNNYIAKTTNEGRIPTRDELISLVKVFDEQTPYKESGTGQIFTGQTLLRTNTEFLTPQEASLLVEQARSDKFFAIEEVTAISEKVSLDEVKALQQRLVQTESIAQKPYEDFKAEITELVTQFKDADVNIKNLETLGLEDQIKVLKLMKTLQEANPNIKQAREFFNTLDDNVIRDIYEQANFSKEIKDSIPLNQAYETVKKIASGQADNPAPVNLLGQDFDVNVETGASQSFLDESNRLYKEMLPDADLDSVTKELEKVDLEADNFVKKADGVLAYLKCI